MNSSSVPAQAVNPASAARCTWVARIVRGDCTTGAWSSQTRSHWIIAVAGRCSSTRIVPKSIANSMSPYPVSHELIS